MSALETVVVALVAGWLAVLTIVVLALVRELGLLKTRASTSEALDEDGLPIGSPVPRTAKAVVPRLDRELVYLLFVSPSCGPCSALLDELRGATLPPAHVHVVIGGGGPRATELAALVPATFDVVVGDDAAAVTSALEVRGTPFALQIENGIVTGKAVVHSPDELARLIQAHDYSDARDMARNLREVYDSASQG